MSDRFIMVFAFFLPGYSRDINLGRRRRVSDVVRHLKKDGVNFGAHKRGTDIRIESTLVDENKILKGGEKIFFTEKISASGPIC